MKFGDCTRSCHENQAKFKMKVITDAHPNDFSWFLENSKNETILNADIKYMQPFGFHHHSDCVLVESNDCFTLRLKDVWDDGGTQYIAR